MAGYLDILRPQVLTEVVKQVVSSADAILNFMGFEPGGVNERFYGHGREGVFHVFDDSRRLAKGMAPGAPAARSDKQPMKAVPFVYPRAHDSVSLLAEFFHNLGKIDDPRTRDEAGRGMIMRQTNMLMQRIANWRVAMTVGTMRDQLYVHSAGDYEYINYTSTSGTQRNTQVPAGNKTQCNMTDRAGTSVFSANIITTSFDNANANIPLFIAQINQARSVQGVGPIRHAHLNSVMWQNLIANNYMAQYAGISQPPFLSFQRVVGTRPDGSALHEYLGSFNSLPGIEFHISDEGIELFDGTNYTFTKHWPDTMILFMGEPKANGKYTAYQGSEPIAEYDGGPESVRVGLSSWSKKCSNPTATEVYVLDNLLPVAHDPYDLVPATCVF